MKHIILKPLSREAKINILVFVILIGFIAAVIYHNIIGSILGKGYPYNTFLFRPAERFTDFTYWIILSRNNNPYLEPNLDLQYINISPFLFFIGHLISFFNLILALRIYTFSFLVFFFYLTYRNLKTRYKILDLFNASIITLLSYPVIFSFDRANTENIIFIFIFLFMYFFHQKKFILSALMLSPALAMKPYPLVFLVMFISEKRYRELFLTAALALVYTIISLLTLSGGVINNISHLLIGLNQYSRDYMIGNEGLYFGNSLFGLIKIILAYISQNNLNYFTFMVSRFYKIYFYLAVIMMGIVSIYLIILEKEMWKKCALLVFFHSLLPFVSADYKLLYVFIPLYLFISKENNDRFDLVYLVLFSLLLIPKNYYHFGFTNLGIKDEANIGIVINPLIMLAMSALIVISGVRNIRAHSKITCT